RLVADGVPAGERTRTGEPVSLAEITVGARYYTNGPGPQAVRGFAQADIAEVLVYSRSLSDAESQQLRQYLDAKYARLKQNLPPPGYQHGTGLFVAAKGKCSLIVDTDGDGLADREMIVADGWKELLNNVDALGVAFDRRDGSVWFGRGTANFTNAYLADKEGK